jgi:3-oxoadipate enol-lactonase
VTDLAHRVDGPADAPVVVLSNSLGTDMSLWEAQVPALAERFRVVRYDARGHGASPVPAGELTIADLGAERASIAGVSLGGMTAMWAASEAAERVDRLVLCCTSAHLGPREMWEERIQTVRASGTAALADATLRRWFTPAADPGVVARFHAMLTGMPRAGYAAGCAAIRDLDLRDRLPRIAAPTLVIGATEDTSAPPAEHAEVVAAGIPGARLVVLDRAAHLANVERAPDVTAAMLEHLSP